MKQRTYIEHRGKRRHGGATIVSGILIVIIILLCVWVSMKRSEAPEPEGDIWSQFKDYMMLGDSRVVGFSSYGYLDGARNLAVSGTTIRDFEAHIEDAAALSPRYVYVGYGINDIGTGLWSTPQEYAEEFIQTISLLQERLPEATVVVSSILPACDPALELNSNWYSVPEFNEALAQACRESGLVFADNTAISDAHPDLWQPDGIHLQPEFYPLWGRNLLEAAQKSTF